MREVAIVSFAQAKAKRRELDANEVEILMPVVQEAVARSGIPKREIGFTVSGSCDYVAGQPFAFVSALDAVGAWPPISESHVEMDGAFACYEAWVKLQTGEVDADSPSRLRTGLRVRARWRRERVGEIRDIECFEPV